jgi:hypothetical protein
MAGQFVSTDVTRTVRCGFGFVEIVSSESYDARPSSIVNEFTCGPESPPLTTYVTDHDPDDRSAAPTYVGSTRNVMLQPADPKHCFALIFNLIRKSRATSMAGSGVSDGTTGSDDTTDGSAVTVAVCVTVRTTVAGAPDVPLEQPASSTPATKIHPRVMRGSMRRVQSPV